MIEIAFCTDNKYAMPAAVMMYSVCLHTGRVSFNAIVPAGFSKQNREGFDRITSRFGASINYVTIPDNLTEGFPVGLKNQPAHVSIATYYRLFMAQLLPQTLDKVIYLDCDLICQSSLEELWNIDLNEAPLACVNDVPRPWQHHQQRLGYDESFSYFNAGVLLVNLNYWRNNNVMEKFVSFLRTSPGKIDFHDQDVLNYVFHENALFLPPRFNATDIFFHREFLDYDYPFSADEVQAARSNPVIVHFTYKNKPWIKGESHTYKDVFLSYKKETPWKRTPLKVKKAETIRGFIVNLLVIFAGYKYHNDYIPPTH